MRPSNKTAIWLLYQRAKSFHKLPSELFGVEDAIAAYLFDAAIYACGATIESALHERVNRGNEKQPKWEPRYSLAQLLDANFTLPRPAPAPKPKDKDPWAEGHRMLLEMTKNPRSRVKMWHATAPN